LCDLPNAKFKISSSTSKYTTESPPQPLNSASLVEQGTKVLQLTPQETLSLAQSLYDKGFITYPNTVSRRFTTSEHEILQKAAVERFGADNVNMQSASLCSLASSAESTDTPPGAIRPVFRDDAVTSLADDAGVELEQGERALFDLIVNSTLASVMLPATRRVTETRIEGSLPRSRARATLIVQDVGEPFESCVFNCSKREVVTPGHLVALHGATPSSNSQYMYQPEMTNFIGDRVFLAPISMISATQDSTTSNNTSGSSKILQHFAGAKRFTPTNLITELTRQGSIDKENPLSTLKTFEFLEKKGYLTISPIKKRTLGKKTYTFEGDVSPSKKGIFLVNYLKTHFDFLVNPLFSSIVQENLHKISDGSLKKDQFFNMFIFGSNETVTKEANSSVSSFFKNGLFRSITARLRSKLQAAPHTQSVIEDTGHSPLQPLKTQFLGRDPETNLSVIINTGKYGHYLQIGNSITDKASSVRRYPLPSWLSLKHPFKNVKEALEFANLPRTICQHPSTNEPIVLCMSKGLLWLQLGKKRVNRVPLEAGIFPDDLTTTMALNKISLLT
jgi:hypothetical protein